MILRESTSPVYDTIQTAKDETVQKTTLLVGQNSQFIEITQNLNNEELQRSLSINIADVYFTGRSK
jgi:hypothetical protein